MAWDVRTGSRSEPEVSLIPVAVEEGDAVVDIGANYGLYTYHLSRAVGPTGTVYAFEPVPFTVGTLCLVAKLLRLRNVQIVPKGCSNETTTLAFAVPVQPSGAIAGGLAHIHDRDDHERYDPPPGSTGVQRVVCEVVALDDFLRPAQDLTFIKCDIEGAELLAFRGCERTIGRFRPTVLCEINPHFLARFDHEIGRAHV
jgi:FkbM family methyltransferase